MRDAYDRWRALDEQRASFEQRLKDRESRLDLLRHYTSELHGLDPRDGEAAALVEERKRISGLGRLAEGTAQVESLLAGDDGGVASALARSQSVLRQLVTLDATLESAAAQIEEASIAAREALSTLRRYTESLEADPARQEWVEARLAALEGVARKHRIEVGDLPGLRERLDAELGDLEASAVSEAELQQRLGQARRTYVDAAAQLTQGRRAAAKALDGQSHGVPADLRHAGRSVPDACRALRAGGVFTERQ